MTEWQLGSEEYIPLCDLLKITGLCATGGHAKMVIADGLVKVDGVVELRKRSKIRDGQTVEFDGRQVRVTRTP